jgi:hypothetical protein
VALADLFQPLIDRFLDALKKALGPFAKLFDFISHFWTSITKAYQHTTDLVTLIIGEVNAWKSFREAVPVRTGVISVPAAIQKTQDFIDEIKAAYFSILDLIKQIKAQVGGGLDESPVTEAEDALKAVEEGGFKDILAKFPKLAKSLEKIFGFVALVIQILEAWVSAVDDLTKIVNVLKDIREEIETGATIFLSQKNKRKRVTTKDGEVLNLRLGNLHS